MVKEIKLANNKGIVFVDNEDYEWLSKYKWRDTLGYARTSIKTSNRWESMNMHQLLINSNGLHIDHIDHNKLNNQKNNLRIVTNSQNQMNRKKQNGTSQFKGVLWHKRDKKWQAGIMLNKKRYHLGYFIDERDAAKAYNKMAIELFDEYAYLNEV